MIREFNKSFGNKVFAIGMLRDWFCPFSLMIHYNNKGSHFGWECNFTLFTWRFYIQFYDTRHWNYEFDRPMTKEESTAT